MTVSLHAKLAAIRAEVGAIEKTGTNTGIGGGYKFVEAVEVARRFVAAASAKKLTMLCVEASVTDYRDTKSGKQYLVTLHTRWRITDGESGESVDVEAFGQGADNADKALPKAQTNAMKYAILLALQAAGDDPEADANTDRIEHAAKPAAPSPAGQPWTADEIKSVGPAAPEADDLFGDLA